MCVQRDRYIVYIVSQTADPHSLDRFQGTHCISSVALHSDAATTDYAVLRYYKAHILQGHINVQI